LHQRQANPAGYAHGRRWHDDANDIVMHDYLPQFSSIMAYLFERLFALDASDTEHLLNLMIEDTLRKSD
jgi:hypothetical protein